MGSHSELDVNINYSLTCLFSKHDLERSVPFSVGANSNRLSTSLRGYFTGGGYFTTRL